MTVDADHSKSATVTAEMESRAMKYLTFNLANEEYGLEILKVREIIGLMEVTTVPCTPDYVRGVINLRGKVIPVVDLRAKFGMESTEDTQQTCIIVVDAMPNGDPVQMGILVDSVSEVLDIEERQIDPPPSFGSGSGTYFILGMGKVDDHVVTMLDIDKVLSGAEIDKVMSAAETA